MRNDVTDQTLSLCQTEHYRSYGADAEVYAPKCTNSTEIGPRDANSTGVMEGYANNNTFQHTTTKAYRRFQSECMTRRVPACPELHVDHGTSIRKKPSDMKSESQ